MYSIDFVLLFYVHRSMLCYWILLTEALASEKESTIMARGRRRSLTMKSMAVEFIYFVAINHTIFSLGVLSINIIILGTYGGCV